MIEKLSEKCPLVFPIHPRTKKNIESMGLWSKFEGIDGLIICEPMGYFDFQKLIKHSKFVVTDSGGIQEETTFCKVPCITIRENTERPITIEIGTNHLVGCDLVAIMEAVENPKTGVVPEKWDGFTTERVIEVLKG
jgi:UDP-N-acetylglucosamine 2-epimerase (non-hydrolysing)